jgi:hypothetical protein
VRACSLGLAQPLQSPALAALTEGNGGRLDQGRLSILLPQGSRIAIGRAKHHHSRNGAGRCQTSVDTHYGWKTEAGVGRPSSGPRVEDLHRRRLRRSGYLITGSACWWAQPFEIGGAGVKEARYGPGWSLHSSLQSRASSGRLGPASATLKAAHLARLRNPGHNDLVRKLALRSGYIGAFSFRSDPCSLQEEALKTAPSC